MKLFGTRKNAEFARKKEDKPGKMPRAVRIFLIIFAALAVLALGVLAVKHFYVRPPKKAAAPKQTVRELPVVTKPVESTDPSAAPKEPEEPVETERPVSHLDGVYNILLAGTDGDGYRTDTIIVAHLDVNEKKAALLSIPRDTPIESGDALVKINSVYAGGKGEGMERLERTLAQLLGFEMDGYLLVDLNAFKAVVDLIGGVEFDVPQDMYYDDPSQDLHIDLKAGKQLLDGEHAMELVRFRKGYASQDIQRTKVQQDFLLALMDQTIRVESLTKLKQYAEIFSTYAVTDMNVGNLLYFAEQLAKCDRDTITTYTAEGQGMMIRGASCYPLFDWSILSIVNEAFNPYDAQITAANIHVITPELAAAYQWDSERAPEPEPEQADAPADGETPPDETAETGETDTADDPAEPDTAETPDETEFWDTPSDEIWDDTEQTQTEE